MSTQADFKKTQKDSKISPEILDEYDKSKDAPKTQDEYIDSMSDEEDEEDNEEETGDSQDNQLSNTNQKIQNLKNMNLTTKLNELCNDNYFTSTFKSIMKAAKKGIPFTYEDLTKDKIDRLRNEYYNLIKRNKSRIDILIKTEYDYFNAKYNFNDNIYNDLLKKRQSYILNASKSNTNKIENFFKDVYKDVYINENIKKNINSINKSKIEAIKNNKNIKQKINSIKGEINMEIEKTVFNNKNYDYLSQIIYFILILYYLYLAFFVSSFIFSNFNELFEKVFTLYNILYLTILILLPTYIFRFVFSNIIFPFYIFILNNTVLKPLPKQKGFDNINTNEYNY